jgi:hypothetical protein
MLNPVQFGNSVQSAFSKMFSAGPTAGQQLQSSFSKPPAPMGGSTPSGMKPSS